MSGFRGGSAGAATALGLAVVGLLGGLFLVLPLALSPVAWRMGRRVVREIDASGGALVGRETARLGWLLGLVGTVVLGAVVAVGLVLLSLAVIAMNAR